MTTKFKKLPQLMQLALQTLNQLHNIPEEMGIQIVLGVANSAVQPHYNIDSGVYGVRPLSLFCLAMVPTGGAKTTAYSELQCGIERYEDSMRGMLSNEKQRFLLESNVHKKKQTQYVKDLESGLNPAMPKEPKPIQTCRPRIGKATTNGVIDQLKTQSFVSLASSEAGEFFNGHAFQGGKDSSKAIEISAALTSMWDGSKIEKITGMEQSELRNRRVNMLFLLQEATVRSFLSNSMYADQGFTHRILITQSPSFEKPDMDISATAKIRMANLRKQLDPFNDRIFDLLNRKLSIKHDAFTGDELYFELDPTVLTMDDAAAQCLANFYNKNKNISATTLKDYAGFGERLHEHALRIAGTLAAFERKSKVTIDEAECAVELMTFYIEQRLSIELEHTANNASKVTVATKLADWIVSRGFDGTKNEFRRLAPCGFQKMDSAQRDSILEEMADMGLITVYTEAAGNGREVVKLKAA